MGRREKGRERGRDGRVKWNDGERKTTQLNPSCIDDRTRGMQCRVQ